MINEFGEFSIDSMKFNKNYDNKKRLSVNTIICSMCTFRLLLEDVKKALKLDTNIIEIYEQTAKAKMPAYNPDTGTADYIIYGNSGDYMYIDNKMLRVHIKSFKRALKILKDKRGRDEKKTQRQRVYK